jgi:hypothetical protein
MSAVLRAYGEQFDVDRFLDGCALTVCAVKRIGEPVFPASQPNGRKQERSGVHISVSSAEFENFQQQISDAIDFLKHNGEQIKRLREFSGVDGVTLDFGIARRDVLVQYDRFPAELIQLAGSLGLDIELSQYPINQAKSAPTDAA